MFDYTDDDDLEEWLRQKAMQPYSDEPGPAAATSGGSDPLEEYMHMRAQFGGGAPAQAPYQPKEYEADPMSYIGAGLGVLADAVGNKGRGVGTILGAVANNYAQDRRQHDQRELELQKASMLGGRRQSADPFEQYMEYQRIQNAQSANARQLDALGLRKDLVDPNSAVAQGKVEQIGNESRSKQGGKLAADYENKDKIGEVSAARSEGTARGREAADAEFAQAKRERDAARAAEIAKAVGPIQAENAATKQEALREDATEDDALAAAAALAKAKSEGGTAGRKEGEREARQANTVGIPGFSAIPGKEAAYGESLGDPVRRAALTKALKSTESGLTALDDLIETRKRVGYDMFGSERTGQETDRRLIGGLIADAAALGILQPSEWSGNIDQILPNTDFDVKKDLYSAYKAHKFPGQGMGDDDVKVQEMMGLRDRLTKALAEGYGVYGGQLDRLNTGSPASPAGSPAASRATPVPDRGIGMPASDGDDEALATDDSGIVTSKTPYLVSNGDGTYDVYEPGQPLRQNQRLKKPLSAYRAGGFQVME